MLLWFFLGALTYVLFGGCDGRYAVMEGFCKNWYLLFLVPKLNPVPIMSCILTPSTARYL